MMSGVSENTMRKMATGALLTATLLSVFAFQPFAFAGDKKKKSAKAEAEEISDKGKFYESLDLSKFVWPAPPAVPRIKYVNYFYGEKWLAPKQEAKKESWMDRVAGVATGSGPRDFKPRWQLVVPYGVAVDSKGRAYISDSKVRAIFIVDIETGKFEMIKNGSDANFKWPTGLAIDDADRLFAADSGMKRVLVFDANHKQEFAITEGMYDPGGVAVDNENRLLYVADTEQDLVLVYDADPPYKLLRHIGVPGKAHTLTEVGEFAKPVGVAVDNDGNVYVTDTWNTRVQVFDADGNFIRAFGKNGDGPGYFARPKGIAIDSDGHVWVADAMQDRVQIYTQEGKLLAAFGGHGLMPGMFQALVGLAFDPKNNRVLTTEQLPGRLQVFKYVTTAEARVDQGKRLEDAKSKVEAERASRKAAAEKAPAAEEPKQ